MYFTVQDPCFRYHSGIIFLSLVKPLLLLFQFLPPTNTFLPQGIFAAPISCLPDGRQQPEKGVRFTDIVLFFIGPCHRSLENVVFLELVMSTLYPR